jgi:C-terminal processing protease CtpA/Prc
VHSGWDEQYFSNLFARSIKDGNTIQLTYLPHFGSRSPHWSKDGKFIMFSTGQNRLAGMIMRVDLLPLPQKFDEDEFEQLFQEKKEEKEGEARDEEKSPNKDDYTVNIVAKNIKDRINRLVEFADSPALLGITPDGKKFIFSNRASGRGVLWVADTDPSGFGFARKLAEGQRFGNVIFSSDSKSFHYLNGGKIYSISLDGGNPKPFAVKATMEIDFHAEKLAAYREAWNYLRDTFADGTFNGLDWSEQYDKYLPYITGAQTLTDFATIGNLMQGDMNTSHMGLYARGRNADSPTGDIGVDFKSEALENDGNFVVENIVEEGPLARENPDVKTGDILVSIDGSELGPGVNIHKLLQGKVGKRVSLLFRKADDGDTVLVKVKPESNRLVNGTLRYNAWVRSNADYVEKISGGRLGYVHIPDMGTDSLRMFRRNLGSEIHGKEGVVIDIRYNNGGWIASFAVDILARKVTHYQTFRGKGRTPSAHLVGNYILGKPTVLVQNEQSLSNAENFSETYQKLELGPVVGTRTCGWLIFTWGTSLINDTFLRLPRFLNFSLEGENMDRISRPVDYFVDRPIGQSLTGSDDQLDKAVEVLLSLIDEKAVE